MFKIKVTYITEIPRALANDIILLVCCIQLEKIKIICKKNKINYDKLK